MLIDNYNKVIEDLECYKNNTFQLTLGDLEKLLITINYDFYCYLLFFKIKRNNDCIKVSVGIEKQEGYYKIINFIKTDPLYISLWRQKQIDSILED